MLSSHDALHSASTSFKHGATPLQIAVAGRRGGAYLAGQAAAAICWLAGVGAPRVVRHVVSRVAAGAGAGQGGANLSAGCSALRQQCLQASLTAPVAAHSAHHASQRE